MTFWNLDRITEALRQQADLPLPRGSVPMSGVSTDTRTIARGDVFVALRGAQFDGHRFLAAAVERGAAAVVVSEAPRIGVLNVPVYQVRDTLVALGALGQFWRRAWGKTVVGVAGSNGKTTTKDLIRAALAPAYTVHATSGNLNNRIGVPLTLLSMPAHADIAVVELGTNTPGELAIVRDIAEPEIAVVTSVAEEHLEGLRDLEGVLREETACYEGAEVGIAPASQPEVAAAARGKAKRVVTAGLDEGDMKPSGWEMSPDGRGSIELNGATVRPPLRGQHNLRNAMLAIAVARECGVPEQLIADGISQMPVPKMRVAVETIGDATLINDAYNSNPGSARAAIELISGLDGERQRVIVLGTMRELGSAADRCHDEISRLALESGCDIVAGIGDFASSLARVGASDERTVTAESVEELWPRLAPRLQRDAVILLKASRGVQLERLVPHVRNWATERC